MRLANRTLHEASAALAATFTSGIRSNFCLTLVPPIKRWDAEVFELESDPTPPWFFDTLSQLRRIIDEEKSGKVRLGLAFDSYGLPDTRILDVFDRARRNGVDLITSHWRRLDASGEHTQYWHLALEAYQSVVQLPSQSRTSYMISSSCKKTSYFLMETGLRRAN